MLQLRAILDGYGVTDDHDGVIAQLANFPCGVNALLFFQLIIFQIIRHKIEGIWFFDYDNNEAGRFIDGAEYPARYA